jgi:hypothetical protein
MYALGHVHAYDVFRRSGVASGVCLLGVAGSIEAVAVMGQSEGSIAGMMLHPSVSDRTPRDWFLVFREGGCESSAAKRILEYACLEIRREGWKPTFEASRW